MNENYQARLVFLSLEKAVAVTSNGRTSSDTVRTAGLCRADNRGPSRHRRLS